MFLCIKGTWYEYGTLVKTLKNISPTVSHSKTHGEKIAKENKLKLLQNNKCIKVVLSSQFFQII